MENLSEDEKKFFRKALLSMFDEGRTFNCLRRSIRLASRPDIISLLRYSAIRSFVVPNDIIRMLADYLDPDIPKSCGPKKGQQKSILDKYEEVNACIHFLHLCNSKEWARAELNSEKKEFELVTIFNEDEQVINWNYAEKPPWKYQEMENIRNRFSFPSKGDLKKYICEEYSISERYFDSLISWYRAQGHWEEEAQKLTFKVVSKKSL